MEPPEEAELGEFPFSPGKVNTKSYISISVLVGWKA